MGEDGKEDQSRNRPAVEWAAGGLGLLITLALFGFVGWQAFQGGGAPQISVHITNIAPSGDSYLVTVVAENRSSQTVAGLGVEGILTTGGGAPEKSSTTFDYVPGNSRARGGLFFNSDPAAGDLQVRPTGYERP